jgi:hypothetical protein
MLAMNPQRGQAATHGRSQTGNSSLTANEREFTRIKVLALISVDSRLKNVCRKSTDFTLKILFGESTAHIHITAADRNRIDTAIQAAA